MQAAFSAGREIALTLFDKYHSCFLLQRSEQGSAIRLELRRGRRFDNGSYYHRWDPHRCEQHATIIVRAEFHPRKKAEASRFFVDAYQLGPICMMYHGRDGTRWGVRLIAARVQDQVSRKTAYSFDQVWNRRPASRTAERLHNGRGKMEKQGQTEPPLVARRNRYLSDFIKFFIEDARFLF